MRASRVNSVHDPHASNFFNMFDTHAAGSRIMSANLNTIDPVQGEIALVACRVCANTADNRRWIIETAMIRSGEKFPYIECSKCGCIQIEVVPADLARHYSEGYYSLEKPGTFHSGALTMLLKRIRTRYWITGRGPLGKALAQRSDVPIWQWWFEHMKIRLDDPILDIGCGAGGLLFNFADHGFTNLTGIDPFLSEASTYGKAHILPIAHSEAAGHYKLVMMHHAFEHMPDPQEALVSVRRLLTDDGTALIRIPVAGGYAWRKYGVHWAALDAPRHLFLHTVKSMQQLAEAAGLEIYDIVFDSGSFQFWASELTAAGRGWQYNAEEYPADHLTMLEAHAAELNKAHDGDQAAFYLRRK